MAKVKIIDPNDTTVKGTTLDEVLKVIDSVRQQVMKVEWNGLEFTVKYMIPLVDMWAFVNSVVGSCFDDDDGEYLPHFKDITFRYCVVKFYTDIELPDEEECDLTELYGALYGTDLIQVIVSHIDRTQMNIIMKSIEEKVEDELSSRRNELAKRLDKTIGAFEEITKSLSEIMGDISSSDIKAIQDALANGGKIDEQYLLDMIMKQHK